MATEQHPAWRDYPVRLYRWVRGWPKRRRRSVIILMLSFLLLGILYPLLGWIAGLTYVPPGWYNASVPIRSNMLAFWQSNLLNGIALSPDVPGLMLGCVDSYLGNGNDHNGIWRSRDYGQHWESLSSPLQKSFCRLIAPSGGDGIFFGVTSQDYVSITPQSLWVTHNAGALWHQVTVLANASNNITVNESLLDTLATSYYRNGHLYAVESQSGTFRVSDDDGATWQATESAPSILEHNGWHIASFAPDYRSTDAWYRAMVNNYQPTEPPKLEHSHDAGQHWQEISVIGAGIAQDIALATTPSQPDRLCVENVTLSYDDSTHPGSPEILSSSDSGQSWMETIINDQPPIVNSDAILVFGKWSRIVIGADGTCYIGRTLSWETPHANQHNHSELTLYQQSPGTPKAKLLVDLPGFGFEGSMNDLNYMPISQQSGRLFVLFAQTTFEQGWWHSMWDFIGTVVGNPPPSQPLYWFPVT